MEFDPRSLLPPFARTFLKKPLCRRVKLFANTPFETSTVLRKRKYGFCGQLYSRFSHHVRKNMKSLIRHARNNVKNLRYCGKIVHERPAKVSRMSDIPYLSYSAKYTTQNKSSVWGSQRHEHGGRKRLKTAAVQFGHVKTFPLDV